MGCGLGAKIAKLILFVVNFAVWLCSLCLLGFGTWMMVQSSRFESLLSEDNLTVVAIIFLIFGAFAFLVGFSGCCGALRDSVFLLKLYFFLMFIIVIGELTAGILTFVFSDQVEESMTNGMTKAIEEEYGQVTAATESVDWVQEEFECCGASNYTDYTDSVWQENITRKEAVPDSCCPLDTEKDTCSYDSPELYHMGCVETTVEESQEDALWIGLAALGFILIEIFAMVMACCLISAEKEEYESV